MPGQTVSLASRVDRRLCQFVCGAGAPQRQIETGAHQRLGHAMFVGGVCQQALLSEPRFTKLFSRLV